MANAITGCRIVFSLILLFFPTFSPGFYTLYLLAGFTDMIDGAVARKTHTVSEVGSNFDTIADLVFFLAVAYKISPACTVPLWLWGWIGFIAAIKIINLLSGLFMDKKFPSVHSVANKTVGLLIFLFPITMAFIGLEYSVVVICTLATLAAVQEGYMIKNGHAK